MASVGDFRRTAKTGHGDGRRHLSLMASNNGKDEREIRASGEGDGRSTSLRRRRGESRSRAADTKWRSALQLSHGGVVVIRFVHAGKGLEDKQSWEAHTSDYWKARPAARIHWCMVWELRAPFLWPGPTSLGPLCRYAEVVGHFDMGDGSSEPAAEDNNQMHQEIIFFALKAKVIWDVLVPRGPPCSREDCPS
ncbi:hypothetical protein ZEAMMB73_Zm00001d009047 [Zea mays]|uniref:Uncharacterized protein n=1 Tax=Zea mays TaxID=4577 RepID=A0A1D6FHJ8_MAIZE|nr:hypothetical protein ZEAMMB73_Zm00001d009047 [Zea mays]